MAYKTRLKVIGSNGAILKQIEISGDDKKDSSSTLKAYNHKNQYNQSKVNVIISNPKLIP